MKVLDKYLLSSLPAPVQDAVYTGAAGALIGACAGYLIAGRLGAIIGMVGLGALGAWVGTQS